MAYPPRKLAFVLAPTDQGTLIVNRFDYKMVDGERGFGVGFMLLENASYEADEVAAVQQLLALRRHHWGDGVVALDCGANIGVFTVEWAKAMTGWGSVLAIEAQERIFYALAGNIALNNCFNARALHAAVAAAPGVLGIPMPDYTRPASFGSLELRPSERVEDIGQRIDYAPERLVQVQAISIDALGLPRLDLLKIDVEGMEVDVMRGADGVIRQHRPIILVERIKASGPELRALLGAHGYRLFEAGLNILAVHPDDPVSAHVTGEMLS